MNSKAQTTTLGMLYAALTLVALWLLARPSTGIRHDGLLYLGQALLNANAPGLKHDLFFAFGSQDSYSLFSPLVLMVYRHLGLGLGQLVLLILCQAALLSALWRLTEQFGSPRDRWLGLLCFAGMSHFFGGLRIFSVAEPFITARTLAEPVICWGFAVILRAQPSDSTRLQLNAAAMPGILLVCASFLIHPLLAVPAAIVLLAWWADERLSWYAVGLGMVALALVLSLLGLLPSTRLTDQFDSEWLGPVSRSNQHVFLANWRLGDFMQLGMDVAVLYVVQSKASGKFKGFLRAAIAMMAAVMCASAIGADLLHAVLITQLQLWRGHWWVHTLALMLLPWVLLPLWRRGSDGKVLAFAVVLLVLAIDVEWVASPAFAVWVALLHEVQRRDPTLATRWRLAFWLATGVALAALLGATVLSIEAELSRGGQAVGWDAWLWAGARLPFFGALILVVGAWAFRAPNPSRLRAWITCGLALTLVGLGLWNWDRRTPWAQQLETLTPLSLPFVRQLPAGAQIFWLDQPAAVWSQLHRASYFSFLQGAGLLFNRGTAMEFKRREAIVAPLYFQRELCKVFATAQALSDAEVPDCTPDIELVQDVCRAPGGPDFIVLEATLGRSVVGEIPLKAPMGGKAYLHRCADLAGT